MTTRKKITFENVAGQQLAAAIELPVKPIKYYALFAHCFSCGKDIIAASRISRALASIGIAVLRFDFTGIGSSDGDFANTNFSSNIKDILAATNFLREHYQAPQLLIGHSWGGTAVLNAAGEIPECKAVVSIGSPATADHILEQFPNERKQLAQVQEVSVNVGGKPFNIKRQFLDDLEAQSTTDKIGALRKALLVFHSPFDNIVPIEEATRIFVAAKHPKSFVTLDKADHLLSKSDDAEYVANTIAAWATRYVRSETPEPQHIPKGEVLIGEGNKKFLREVATDDHSWLSDEPTSYGGDNLGPDPYEQLLSSLGACTSMTLRMYANHKGWPVDDIIVELKHSRVHEKDCEDPDKADCKLELIEKTLTIEGDLDEKQKRRLLEVADRCPVHKTLLGNLKIATELVDDV